MSVTLSPIEGVEGRIVGFSSIARDIAQRKRAEQEQRRTELLRELAEVQEGERRRISHELHDQMEQQLAALKLGLERMRDAPPDRDRVQQLLDLVKQVGRDVHRIALELRPATLDDLGLQAALTHCVDEWSERTGVEVDFHHEGLDGGRLSPTDRDGIISGGPRSPDQRTQARQAAKRVTLILECRQEHLRLTIEDNGGGFDVNSTLRRSNSERRLGLPGMKERVDAIGGEFLVESTPGSGTSLFIRIPLAQRGG